jgi:hypothetical protein
MALSIGTVAATSGMAGAIYDQIQANLEPGLGDMSEEDKEPIRDSWRKLAHGIATGVVQHLLDNLELTGVQTRGNVSVTVSGSTALVSGHQHGAGTLSGAQNNVTFTQVAGTGTFA